MSIEKICIHQQYNYQTLVEHVHGWDIQARIAQKYATWQLKYTLPHLSPTWITLIHHSLIYYLLKNIPWIFSQVQTDWLITHSHSIKTAYTSIIIKKSQNFDFKLIILVKCITYFIGGHIRQVLADCTLENDIYQLIVRNLLGISVQTSAYICLVKQMRSVQAARKERESRDLDIVIDQSDIYEVKVRPLPLYSRRQARKQTIHKMLQISEQHCNLQEMRSLLKENLYVKPNSRPQTPKYSINQLRELGRQSEDQHVLRERQTASLPNEGRSLKKKKQTMHSNQLSNAFELNSRLTLKDVKKFTIQRSTGLLEPLRQSYHLQITKKPQKLQLKRQQSRVKLDSKKAIKTTKQWHQVVKNMKNDLYGSQATKDSKNGKEGRKNDYELDYPRLRLRDTTKSNNTKPTSSHESSHTIDNLKFHKLNLMNNPNVLILDQNIADNRQEQIVELIAKNYSLFHLKDQFPHKQLQRHKPSYLLDRNSSLYCEYQHAIPT